MVCGLSERQPEDDAWPDDADEEDETEEGGRDGSPEIERPPQPVARWDKQRRIIRVLVKLAEAPVLGDERPRRRAAQAEMGANRNHPCQDEAEQLQVRVPDTQSCSPDGPHLDQ